MILFLLAFCCTSTESDDPDNVVPEALPTFLNIDEDHSGIVAESTTRETARETAAPKATNSYEETNAAVRDTPNTALNEIFPTSDSDPALVPKANGGSTQDGSSAASEDQRDEAGNTPIRALPCRRGNKCSFHYKVSSCTHNGVGQVTNIASARKLSKTKTPDQKTLITFTVDVSPHSATEDGKALLWSLKARNLQHGGQPDAKQEEEKLSKCEIIMVQNQHSGHIHHRLAQSAAGCPSWYSSLLLGTADVLTGVHSHPTKQQFYSTEREFDGIKRVEHQLRQDESYSHTVSNSQHFMDDRATTDEVAGQMNAFVGHSSSHTRFKRDSRHVHNHTHEHVLIVGQTKVPSKATDSPRDDAGAVTYASGSLHLMDSEPAGQIPVLSSSAQSCTEALVQKGWKPTSKPKPTLDRFLSPHWSPGFVKDNFMYLAKGGNTGHTLHTAAYIFMSHPTARLGTIRRLKSGEIDNWKLSARLLGMMGSHLMRDEKELTHELTGHLLDLFQSDLPLAMAREQALTALLQPTCYSQLPTIRKLFSLAYSSSALADELGERGSYKTQTMHVLHGMLAHHLRCSRIDGAVPTEVLAEANKLVQPAEAALLTALNEDRIDNAMMYLTALENSQMPRHAAVIAKALSLKPPVSFRREAARVLTKLDSQDAKDALLILSEDKDVMVQEMNTHSISDSVSPAPIINLESKEDKTEQTPGFATMGKTFNWQKKMGLPAHGKFKVTLALGMAVNLGKAADGFLKKVDKYASGSAKLTKIINDAGKVESVVKKVMDDWKKVPKKARHALVQLFYAIWKKKPDKAAIKKAIESLIANGGVEVLAILLKSPKFGKEIQKIESDVTSKLHKYLGKEMKPLLGALIEGNEDGAKSAFNALLKQKLKSLLKKLLKHADAETKDAIETVMMGLVKAIETGSVRRGEASLEALLRRKIQSLLDSLLKKMPPQDKTIISATLGKVLTAVLSGDSDTAIGALQGMLAVIAEGAVDLLLQRTKLSPKVQKSLGTLVASVIDWNVTKVAHAVNNTLKAANLSGAAANTISQVISNKNLKNPTWTSLDALVDMAKSELLPILNTTLISIKTPKDVRQLVFAAISNPDHIMPMVTDLLTKNINSFLKKKGVRPKLVSKLIPLVNGVINMALNVLSGEKANPSGLMIRILNIAVQTLLSKHPKLEFLVLQMVQVGHLLLQGHTNEALSRVADLAGNFLESSTIAKMGLSNQTAANVLYVFKGFVTDNEKDLDTGLTGFAKEALKLKILGPHHQADLATLIDDKSWVTDPSSDLIDDSNVALSNTAMQLLKLMAKGNFKKAQQLAAGDACTLLRSALSKLLKGYGQGAKKLICAVVDGKPNRAFNAVIDVAKGYVAGSANVTNTTKGIIDNAVIAVFDMIKGETNATERLLGQVGLESLKIMLNKAGVDTTVKQEMIGVAKVLEAYLEGSTRAAAHAAETLVIGAISAKLRTAFKKQSSAFVKSLLEIVEGVVKQNSMMTQRGFYALANSREVTKAIEDFLKKAKERLKAKENGKKGGLSATEKSMANDSIEMMELAFALIQSNRLKVQEWLSSIENNVLKWGKKHAPLLTAVVAASLKSMNVSVADEKRSYDKGRFKSNNGTSHLFASTELKTFGIRIAKIAEKQLNLISKYINDLLKKLPDNASRVVKAVIFGLVGQESRVLKILFTMVKKEKDKLLKHMSPGLQNVTMDAAALGINALLGKKINPMPLLTTVIDMAIKQILVKSGASSAEKTFVQSIVAAILAFFKKGNLSGDGISEAITLIGNAIWTFASPHIKVPGVTGADLVTLKKAMKILLDAILDGNSSKMFSGLWGIGQPLIDNEIQKAKIPFPAHLKTFEPAVKKLLIAVIRGVVSGHFGEAEKLLVTSLIEPIVQEAGAYIMKNTKHKLSKNAKRFINTIWKQKTVIMALLGGDFDTAATDFIDIIVKSQPMKHFLKVICPSSYRPEAEKFIRKALKKIAKSILGSPASTEEAFLLEAAQQSKFVPKSVHKLEQYMGAPTRIASAAIQEIEQQAAHLHTALSTAINAHSAPTQLIDASKKKSSKNLLKLYANIGVEVFGNKFTILGGELGDKTKFSINLFGVSIFPHFNAKKLVATLGDLLSNAIMTHPGKAKKHMVGGSPIPGVVGICSTDTKGKTKGKTNFKQWSVTFFKLESHFMAGPVPLSASIQLDGHLGIAWVLGPLAKGQTAGTSDLTCEGGMMAVGAPFAGASLKVEAAVNAGFVSAGIGAVVDLIRISLPLTIEAMIGSTPHGNNNCVSMNVVTQAGGGKFFVFVHFLGSSHHWDIFQWGGAKWVWPKPKTLPTVDGQQPKKLNFFGKCMYDAKYEKALKQPHIAAPPSSYNSLCICTLYGTSLYEKPLYKEMPAAGLAHNSTAYKDGSAAGGYWEVGNIYGKVKYFRPNGRLWLESRSLKCMGNCDRVTVMSYDADLAKRHPGKPLSDFCSKTSKGAVKVPGRKGSAKQNYVFEISDFTSETGNKHKGGKSLAGNVCGIFIRARANKNNPGPTLCEELHECKQCNDQTITKKLVDGKDGCSWKDTGWYDRTRDKMMKCASTNWIKHVGSTPAGGSNKLIDQTPCGVSPMQCAKTTVAGEWTSATLDGKEQTAVQYARLNDMDCVTFGKTYATLATAQLACDHEPKCKGVRHKTGVADHWLMCQAETILTRKLVHAPPHKNLLKSKGISNCLATDGTQVTMDTCTMSPALSRCRGSVSLYSQIAYRGKAALLQVGSYNKQGLVASGALVDGAASITVPTGCKLQIFASDNFKGHSTTLLPGDYSKTGMAPTSNEVSLVESTNETVWIQLDQRQVKASMEVKATEIKAMGSIRILDFLVDYVPLSPDGSIPNGNRHQLANDEWEQDETGYFRHSKTGKYLSIAGDIGLFEHLPAMQPLALSGNKIPLCTNHQCSAGQLEAVYVMWKGTSNGERGRSARQCKVPFGEYYGEASSPRFWPPGGSALVLSNKRWATMHCKLLLPGSTPGAKHSHTFSPDSFKCQCKPAHGQPQCWYPNQEGRMACKSSIDVMKNVCLVAPSTSYGQPGIANCKSEHAQRWTLQPYRTTWQARIGYIIYKKGPQIVKKLRVTQTPGCDVFGENSKLKGIMKGLRLAVQTNSLNMQAPLGEEGSLGIEGTVNAKETMLTWNTVPPTYWIKASVLENRGPFEKTVKSNAKYAEQQERMRKTEAKKREGLKKQRAKAKSEKSKKKLKKEEKELNEKSERKTKHQQALHNKQLCEDNQQQPCTDNLCGPFKGKGYVAAPTSSNCGQSDQSDQSLCAVSCGLSKVWPKHKTDERFFHQHGWPKELVYCAGCSKHFQKADQCNDSFSKTFYYWKHVAPTATGNFFDNGVCSWIAGQKKCRATEALSSHFPNTDRVFNTYTFKKFSKLFCKKKCGFHVPPTGCHAEWAEKEQSAKQEKTRKENSAKAQAKETKCKTQYGLKGAGSSTYEWSRLHVHTRRLLGSGHLADAGHVGDCHDYQGNFIGRGPCVTFNNGNLPSKLELWKARRRRGDWVVNSAIHGCESKCQPLAGCFAYNGAYHYRRRAGRTYCMFWKSNQANCP
jgi:hypothetical protein